VATGGGGKGEGAPTAPAVCQSAPTPHQRGRGGERHHRCRVSRVHRRTPSAARRTAGGRRHGGVKVPPCCIPRTHDAASQPAPPGGGHTRQHCCGNSSARHRIGVIVAVAREDDGCRRGRGGSRPSPLPPSPPLPPRPLPLSLTAAAPSAGGRTPNRLPNNVVAITCAAASMAAVAAGTVATSAGSTSPRHCRQHRPPRSSSEPPLQPRR